MAKVKRMSMSKQRLRDAKDAARYRFLRRDNGPHAPFVCIFSGGGAFSRWTEAAADAQVDEAMAAIDRTAKP